MVAAAASALSTLPLSRARAPASRWPAIAIRSASESSPLATPGPHVIVSSRDAASACQYLSATTTTPNGSVSTSITPGRALALPASTDSTCAPSAGGCTTSARTMFGIVTSMPKTVEPSTLPRRSTRWPRLPISLNSLDALSRGCLGTGWCAAAFVSSP